jgi:hypothetical protein
VLIERGKNMRRILVGSLLVLGIMLIAAPAGAANVLMRYFESADVILTDEQFQFFSYSALEGEEITIVAYGLDEGMVPALTLLDQNSSTVAEDPNIESEPVAVIEYTTPVNGVYTFSVNRLTDAGGLMRVMVFTGDALGGDYSLLDTIDPLLPSRAYLVSAPESGSSSMTIQVEPTAGTTGDGPLVYASRGTAEEVPALDERTTAIEERTWVNEAGEVFYTVNVRATPEPLPFASKLAGFFDMQVQQLETATIHMDIGEGSDNPEFIPRPECRAEIQSSTELLAGPSDDYISLGQIPSGQAVEIAGENGDYFLVFDANNPTGASWVLKSSVRPVSDLTGEDCARVELVPAPDLTPENSPQEGQTGGGGGTGGGIGGLPPAGDPPPNGPGPDETAVFNPPPCTENCGDPGGPGGPTSGFTLTCDTNFGDLYLNYSGVPPGATLTWLVFENGNPFSSGGATAIGTTGTEHVGFACSTPATYKVDGDVDGTPFSSNTVTCFAISCGS